jgi:hypothetical protein
VKDAALQCDEALELLYVALSPGSALLLAFLNTTVMGIQLYRKTLATSSA